MSEIFDDVEDAKLLAANPESQAKDRATWEAWGNKHSDKLLLDVDFMDTANRTFFKEKEMQDKKAAAAMAEGLPMSNPSLSTLPSNAMVTHLGFFDAAGVSVEPKPIKLEHSDAKMTKMNEELNEQYAVIASMEHDLALAKEMNDKLMKENEPLRAELQQAKVEAHKVPMLESTKEGLLAIMKTTKKEVEEGKTSIAEHKHKIHGMQIEYSQMQTHLMTRLNEANAEKSMKEAEARDAKNTLNAYIKWEEWKTAEFPRMFTEESGIIVVLITDYNNLFDRQVLATMKDLGVIYDPPKYKVNAWIVKPGHDLEPFARWLPSAPIEITSRGALTSVSGPSSSKA